jgi:aminoglycoside phosphotransferase (APT) family kinase protein
MQIGKLIGTGKEAEVFEYGHHVLKLYASRAGKDAAFREAATLAIAENRGLRAPAAHEVRAFGARWGIVMDRVDGQPFAEAMLTEPTSLPAYLAAMVALHRSIHAAAGAHLGDLRTRLGFNIGRAEMLGGVRQRRLLDRLSALPAGDRFCHGDFHPFNILGVPGDARVVDWLDASCGPAAADVCRTHVLLQAGAPQLADAYISAYADAAGIATEAVLAWLSVVAAARLAENVPQEVDALMALADTV